MPRPKSPDPILPAERMARYRKLKEAQGGRELPCIMLSAEDSAKLARIEQARGMRPTEVIRQLIREAGS